MAPYERPQSPEQTLISIASNQVVRRTAALEAGVSRRQLEHRLRTGFLTPDGRGVYRIAAAPRIGATAQRAALDCVDGLGIGFWSALWTHRATGGAPPPRIVHVLIDWDRRVASTDWYRTHRTRRIEDDELVLVKDNPIATMARTLRDLAAVLPYKPWAAKQLTGWTEEALIQDTLRLEDLAEMAERERCSRVRKRLSWLHDRQNGDDLEEFRNIAETWLRDLCERRGLPRPQFNVVPPGLTKEVDAYWELPLIVEFDGFRYHKTRTKHVKDRRRDRRAWRSGIPTVRITKDDFEDDLPQLERDIEFFLTGHE